VLPLWPLSPSRLLRRSVLAWLLETGLRYQHSYIIRNQGPSQLDKCLGVVRYGCAPRLVHGSSRSFRALTSTPERRRCQISKYSARSA
jgi:hypothetical protein